MQIHCTECPDASTKPLVLSNGPSDKQRAVDDKKVISRSWYVSYSLATHYSSLVNLGVFGGSELCK